MGRESSQKIISVVGTRPNLIKLIPGLADVIINTGQHWHRDMNDDFYVELGIPEPKYNLHQTMLSGMIDGIMKVIDLERPSLIVVYGDTRSTYAAAIAANEKHIPLAHIEAGMRLYDKTRPEESYRVAVDHLSTYLFCVNDRCAENLVREGIRDGVFVVGDVLYDRYLQHRKHKDYVVLTVHRDENTNKRDLENIMHTVASLGKIYFPVHPRTMTAIKKYEIEIPKNVEVLKPQPYIKMMELLKDAKGVLTDSGGIQRECHFCGTPCVVLGASEWAQELTCFGNGTASDQIIEILRGKDNG